MHAYYACVLCMRTMHAYYACVLWMHAYYVWHTRQLQNLVVTAYNSEPPIEHKLVWNREMGWYDLRA